MRKKIWIKAEQCQREHRSAVTEHFAGSEKNRKSEKRAQDRSHDAGRNQSTVDAIGLQELPPENKALPLEVAAGIRRLGHVSMKEGNCTPHFYKRWNFRIKSEVSVCPR